MVIKGRKFDVRVWALVTHEYKCYVFREGYLRLSSEELDLDNADNPDSKFVHLTNNAVQKFNMNYCSEYDGNQMSFGEFEVKYCQANF